MNRPLFALLCACATACATTSADEKKDQPDPKGDAAKTDGEADAKKPLPSTGAIDVAKLQADAMKMMGAMRAAQVVADATCAPLESKPLSLPEERQYGTLLSSSLMEKRPLLSDGAGPKQLAELGLLLAKRSSRPDLPWTFGVLRSDVADAFAEPGGYVFVTTGLLRKVKNEAELAGVLAHEIGHVSLGHAEKSLRQAIANQCRAATTTAELARNGLDASPQSAELIRFAEQFKKPPLTTAPGDFQRFIFNAVVMVTSMPHTDTEYEADRAAATMLVGAGYDVAATEELLTRLAAEPLVTDDQGRKVRQVYLAFKPGSDERNAMLKALREGELAPLVHRAARPPLPKDLAELK